MFDIIWRKLTRVVTWSDITYQNLARFGGCVLNLHNLPFTRSWKTPFRLPLLPTFLSGREKRRKGRNRATLYLFLNSYVYNFLTNQKTEKEITHNFLQSTGKPKTSLSGHCLAEVNRAMTVHIILFFWSTHISLCFINVLLSYVDSVKQLLKKS